MAIVLHDSVHDSAITFGNTKKHSLSCSTIREVTLQRGDAIGARLRIIIFFFRVGWGLFRTRPNSEVPCTRYLDAWADELLQRLGGMRLRGRVGSLCYRSGLLNAWRPQRPVGVATIHAPVMKHRRGRQGFT